MRTYTLSEIEMPSVTTVLDLLDKSSALMPWAVRQASAYIRTHRAAYKERGQSLNELLFDAEKNFRTVSDEAKDIGSEIHDMIEQYIKHGRDAVGNYRPEVEHGFLAFLNWEQANGVKWIASERTIAHPNLCYAGTLDAVCEIGDKKYVIDFKSSRGFYDTYGMQIAAYREAYMVETLERIDGCGILRLDKATGEPEWKDYTKSQERDFIAFEKLLAFWYAHKKRRLKNNPRVAEGAT